MNLVENLKININLKYKLLAAFSNNFIFSFETLKIYKNKIIFSKDLILANKIYIIKIKKQ